MAKSLQNEIASAPLGVYESDDAHYVEGAEITATASSTLGNEMEGTGSRKSRNQAGAELGRQEPVETAPVDETAGMLACCVALASCPLGELRGVGVPGAALARLVATLQPSGSWMRRVAGV